MVALGSASEGISSCFVANVANTPNTMIASDANATTARLARLSWASLNMQVFSS